MGAGNNHRIGIEYTLDDGGGYAFAACMSNSTDPDHVFVRLSDVYLTPYAIPDHVRRQFRLLVKAAVVPPPTDNTPPEAMIPVIAEIYGEAIAVAIQTTFGVPADAAGIYRALHALNVIDRLDDAGGLWA